MKRFTKKIYKLLIKLKFIKKRTPYKCSVCNKDNIFFHALAQKYHRQFSSVGFIHSIYLFETLNLFEYACSNCNSADRDRLYALYFNKNLKGKDVSKIKLLDIAPTNTLRKYLLTHFKKKNYRTADLLMENVEDKVDVQNMSIYEDNTWDFIICSHVLEHVKDDKKALNELYRVLKPAGKAILMAPINLGLEKSFEADPEKNYSDEERWRYFGQDDHERIYSKTDFVERIKDSGFKLHQLDINYFGEKTFIQYGIDKKSVLYIGEKI